MRRFGLALLVPLFFGLVFGDVPPVGGASSSRLVLTTPGGHFTDCLTSSRRVPRLDRPRVERTTPALPGRDDAVSAGLGATR
jgi:hypothetical protein